MRCFLLVPLDWPDSHALKHLRAGVEGQDCSGVHPRTVEQPQGQALHKGEGRGFGGAVVNGSRDGWQGQDRVQANNVSILQLQHPWQECFGGLKNNREEYKKGLLSRDTIKTVVTGKKKVTGRQEVELCCSLCWERSGRLPCCFVIFQKILNRQSLCRNKTKSLLAHKEAVPTDIGHEQDALSV